LPGDAAKLDDRQGRGEGRNHGHLQKHPEKIADIVGRVFGRSSRRSRPRDIGKPICAIVTIRTRSKAQCEQAIEVAFLVAELLKAERSSAAAPMRCSGIKAASLERMMTVFPTLFVSHGAPNLVLHENLRAIFSCALARTLAKSMAGRERSSSPQHIST